MKRTFKFYVLCWVILVAAFNMITFLTPNEAGGYNKFGGSFWPGYVLIMLSFIGQLACAGAAFKQSDLRRFFYNIPLITISYVATILSIIVGVACMAIPDLPAWVGGVVCVVVLVFTAVAVVKAKTAAELISDVDEKVSMDTSFIRSLTAEANGLADRAKSEEAKVVAKKVFEAIRYADPVSSDSVRDLEMKISMKLGEFSAALDADEKVEEVGDELLAAIDDRNRQIKNLK